MMGEIAPRSNGGFHAVLEQSNLGTGTPTGAQIGSIVCGAGALSAAMGDVVIGTRATVIKPGGAAGGSVIIGMNAKTTAGASLPSIGIGFNATAGDQGVSVGSSAANGLQSVAIGVGSQATGSRAQAFGNSANASGNWALAIGKSSGASNTYAIAIGEQSFASSTNSIGIVRNGGAAHDFSVVIGTGGGGAAASGFIGDNVFYNSHYKNTISNFVMQLKTTDATPKRLGIGGDNVESPSNNCVFPINSSYVVEGQVIARNTAASTGSQTAVWDIKFVIYKDASAASTALVGTPIISVVAKPTGTTTWELAITADTTNGCWVITATGEASKTIRWTAGLRAVKVVA